MKRPVRMPYYNGARCIKYMEMKLYKSPVDKLYGYRLDGSQDHLIPQDFVALTQAEIDARNAQIAADQQAQILQQQAAADARASAMAKLRVLGLTQDEVTALVGSS